MALLFKWGFAITFCVSFWFAGLQFFKPSAEHDRQYVKTTAISAMHGVLYLLFRKEKEG